MGGCLTRYNAIQLSESSYKEVTDLDHINVKQTSIEAKGKGTLITYIVTEKDVAKGED
jgi:hypothetical protein